MVGHAVNGSKYDKHSLWNPQQDWQKHMCIYAMIMKKTDIPGYKYVDETMQTTNKTARLQTIKRQKLLKTVANVMSC